MANHTKSISKTIATGTKIGTTKNAISIKSIKKPKINIANIDINKNVHLSPGKSKKNSS